MLSKKKMTSVKASEFYHVPQSTIWSHINNDLLHVGAGRPFYLSPKQEIYLVELIKSLDEIGIRLTKSVLMKVIGEYLRLAIYNARFNSKVLSSNVIYILIIFIENEPSFHWLTNFLLRNKKDIKMIKEKKIEKSRRNGFTEEVRTNWFNKLNEILVKNDLVHRPIPIWNMGESGFSDDTPSNLFVILVFHNDL